MGACTIEIEYACGNERRVRSNLSQTCATNRQPVAITRKTSAVG